MGTGERAHGLRLVFDPELDGGGWPGPLGDRSASIAEACLGPQGLLDRLETELGLGAVVPRAAERSAQLAHDLDNKDGYWRASYAVDPLGTAQRLLSDRDALWLWGWRGQPVSARLSDLAKATSSTLPGLPDRLQIIASALELQRPDIETLRLCSPEKLMPTRWRVIFEKLRGLGISISDSQLMPAQAKGDLSKSRTPQFTPIGDGTLTLLRSHGPMTTADEIAGCLAALDSLDGVVLVGADSVLVSALEQRGLPRPQSTSQATASLSALRLSIEAMFHPCSPAQLYALLSLNPGPVPPSIARRLIGALSQMPGRGTQQWNDALEKGLNRVDEDRRESVRKRISGLLQPVAGRDETVTTEQVIARLRVLSTWARGAAQSTPSVQFVGTAADVFAKILSGLSLQNFARTQLQRLLDELDDFGVSAGSAQAGLASVNVPGAVLGPARIIVWWGFTRDRARRPARLRLSQKERTALHALGVTPPDAGTLAKANALYWRRPLEQATEAVILACPRTTDSGERAFPHPLWDELSAAMGSQSASKLTAPRLLLPAQAKRRPLTLRPLPSPAIDWNAGEALKLREKGESPSSLEKLLGCSFAWALHYHGRIRRRFEAPAEPNHRLYGLIAHKVLADVFEQGPMAAGVAKEKASDAMDQKLGSLCETLLLPRYQVERAQLKRAVVQTAVRIERLLADSGAQVRGVEVHLEKQLPDLLMSGYVDLLLTAPDVVIDLKWGRTTNRTKMESGTALQLAAYAELGKTGSNRPEVGYLIIRTQELFGEPGSCLPDADIPGEHPAIDTWRGAMSSLTSTKTLLAEGKLSAPGAEGSDGTSALVGELLRIAPGCHFCGLSGICGRGAAQ